MATAFFTTTDGEQYYRHTSGKTYNWWAMEPAGCEYYECEIPADATPVVPDHRTQRMVVEYIRECEMNSPYRG